MIFLVKLRSFQSLILFKTIILFCDMTHLKLAYDLLTNLDNKVLQTCSNS